MIRVYKLSREEQPQAHRPSLAQAAKAEASVRRTVSYRAFRRAEGEVRADGFEARAQSGTGDCTVTHTHTRARGSYCCTRQSSPECPPRATYEFGAMSDVQCPTRPPRRALSRAPSAFALQLHAAQHERVCGILEAVYEWPPPPLNCCPAMRSSDGRRCNGPPPLHRRHCYGSATARRRTDFARAAQTRRTRARRRHSRRTRAQIPSPSRV